MKNVLPSSVKVVSGDEYNPRHLEVRNAITGDLVQGVMAVTVAMTRHEMVLEVVHTLRWPVEASRDAAVNLSEIDFEELGPDTIIWDGIVCGKTKYVLKGITSLEASYGYRSGGK